MGIITIKKAKITSMNHMEIEYEEIHEQGREKYTSEAIKKLTWDPHNDLKVAFDGLKIHLAWLCEQIPASVLRDYLEKDNQLPDMSKIRVSGFVIGGADEHEGVTIIGRRQLANNRVLNLVSPFAKWEDEHNGYENAEMLRMAVLDCIDEVIAYLDGKRAPSKQLAIDFAEGEK